MCKNIGLLFACDCFIGRWRTVSEPQDLDSWAHMARSEVILFLQRLYLNGGALAVADIGASGDTKPLVVSAARWAGYIDVVMAPNGRSDDYVLTKAGREALSIDPAYVVPATSASHLANDA